MKWLTKWSSMARDYFEEVLRANYKRFIKNNWFFCVPYRAHFEHFEHKKFEPSELERNFFRAHTEPSENRAKFFSSISSTSALRAGKFSSEPSGFSSERCSYPTLVTSGYFYGSDGLRSPLTISRDPGTPEYKGEENPDTAKYSMRYDLISHCMIQL